MTTTSSDPAARIAVLGLDVDGVLTSGVIMLDADGREIKAFHAADGVGLRTWSRLGLRSAIVTGRTGHAVLHRAADLGIHDVIQGSKDKSAALDELIRRTGVPAERIAFLGDDWPDLAMLRRVGYPMAVANADARVKAAARFVTQRRGGEGAVREAIEHLLERQGRLAEAVALYDGAGRA